MKYLESNFDLSRQRIDLLTIYAPRTYLHLMIDDGKNNNDFAANDNHHDNDDDDDDDTNNNYNYNN